MTESSTSVSGQEQRQLTVVVVDMVGSTPLQERLGVERFNVVQTAFLQCCREQAALVGAEAIRFTGDGFAFAFGRQAAHEQQAELAAVFAQQLIASVAALEPLNTSLQARVSIGTGLAIVVSQDPQQKVQQTVQQDEGVSSGPVLILASRLNGLAEPGQVLLDTVSANLVHKAFDTHSIGHHSLKGISAPVEAFALGAAVPEQARLLRQAKIGPVLERNNETQLLQVRWQEVCRAATKGIWIEGEAGVGKSRLVVDFLSGLDPEQTVIWQCRPGINGLQLGPARNEDTGDALQPVLSWLTTFAGPDTQSLSHQLPVTMDAQSVGMLDGMVFDSGEAIHHAAPEAVREGRERAVLTLLEKWAQQTPVCLVVEDAHWLDETTARLLLNLMSAQQDVPLLLLVTSRPVVSEHTPLRGALRDQLSLWPLRPLSDEAARSLVVSRLAQHGLTCDPQSPEVTQVLERCDGIPLFIERVADEFAKSGVVGSAASPESTAQTRIAADSAGVPEVLFEVLMSGLDRVPGGRRVAQAASIQGRDVSLAQLQVLLEDLSAPEIDQVIQELLGEQILERLSDTGEYRFHHHLMRDVAYSSLLNSDRGTLHGVLAQALTQNASLADQRRHAYHATRANHFEQAVRLALNPAEQVAEALAGAQAWVDAAIESVNRFEESECENRLQRASALVDDINLKPTSSAGAAEVQVAICQARAHACSIFKGWGSDEVAQAVDAGLAVAAETGEDFSQLAAWQELQLICGGHFITRGSLERAGEHGHNLLQQAERTDAPPLLKMAAHRSLAGHYCLTGQHHKAVETCEQGLALYQASFDRAPSDAQLHSGPADRGLVNVTDHRATILVYQAMSTMCLGDVPRAMALIEAAAEHARALNHGHSLAHALVLGAGLQIMSNLPTFEMASQAANEFVEERKFATWLAPSRMMQGYCAALRQDVYAGIATIDSAAQGNPAIYAPFGISLIVQAELQRGSNPENTRPLLEAAVAVTQQTAETWFLPEVYRLRGVAEALIAAESSGDPLSAAEPWMQRALALAGDHGANLWELKTGLSYFKQEDGLAECAGAKKTGTNILKAVLPHFPADANFPDLDMARDLV